MLCLFTHRQMNNKRRLSNASLLPHTPSWLLFLACLMIFSPLLEGGTTHLAVMGIRLFILVWMSAYLWTSIESRTFRYWISPHLLAVLLFLAVAVLSTATSSYTHQSFQWLAVLFSYAGLLYLIVLFLVTWDHIQKLLLVLCGVGLFESVWALVQAQQGVLRPTGTFFNPNFLAGYVSVCWALIFGYIIHLPKRSFQREFWKTSVANAFVQIALPFVVLGIISLIIVLTGSRGAILALLASMVVMLGIRHGWKGQGLVLVLLLLIVLVPNPVQKRVIAEHDRNPATYSRIQMWKGAVQEIVDHPFGVGLGLHRYFAPQYSFPVEGQIIRYGQVSRTAHNEFLQVGIETGVVGLLVFVGGILLLIVEVTKVLRKTLTRLERAIVVGSGGGVVVILIHATVDSNLHVPSIAIVLTVLAAVLLSASRLTGASRDPVREWSVKSPAILGGIGVALLSLTLFFILKFSLAWVAYESGLEAMRAGNYPKALNAYQEAISIDPTKALYHSALASAYFQKFQLSGNVTNAEYSIVELERAIELNPRDGRVYGLLGHVLSTVGSSHAMNTADSSQQHRFFQEANTAYRTSLHYQPFSAFNRLALARISMALDKGEQGEALVQEAILIEPNFLPGREWLAKRMWNAGRKEEALSQLQEIKLRKRLFKDWQTTTREKNFLQVDFRALEVLAKSTG